jgi:hypothetical protein
LIAHAASIARVLLHAKAVLGVLTSIAFVTLVSCFPVTSQQTETTAASADTPTDIVKAGEVISFTITVDRPPNFNGANLFYIIRDPNGSRMQSGIQLEPMKRVYRLDIKVPPAATGGTWSLSELNFYSGSGVPIPVKFKPVTFRVIANRDLVFPTAAEAQINPSQIQLLRRESVSLQTRIQALKANLARFQPPFKRDPLIEVLERNLKEALADVQRTERTFIELGGNQPALSSGKVFFADLRASYLQALLDLDQAHQAKISNADSIRDVVFIDQPRYPALAQGPLRVLEQNELAYFVVATKEDFTFNLEVNSVPAGATVFFWRRGDSERKNNNPTNSTLAALPYAIWFVRLQMPGYKDEEREHDPFREPNHVLSVELHKQ